MYYGGKKGMGVSPLIHLSPSQNRLHPGLWRAGAGALKRRQHVREMETFHVVNPGGCQRNPNERGSCPDGLAGRTLDCFAGEEPKGDSGRGEPGLSPCSETLSAPLSSLCLQWSRLAHMFSQVKAVSLALSPDHLLGLSYLSLPVKNLKLLRQVIDVSVIASQDRTPLVLFLGETHW